MARMRTRQLGTTGLTVSQIGLGTWPLAGNDGIKGYGKISRSIAIDTVRTAFESGITLYDCADVYGNGFAETLLSAALGRVRDRVVICTKGGWDLSIGASNFDSKFIRQRVEDSLRRLASDYIDVYLLHNPPARLVGLRETFRPLEQFRSKGLLRHIGVSVTHPSEALLALDVPHVEVIQVPYNLVLQDADQRLLRSAHAAGKGIIIREALGNGLLTGKYYKNDSFAQDDFRSDWPRQSLEAILDCVVRYRPYIRAGESMLDLALRFVLDRPEIATVVVGARSPDQLPDLVRAGTLDPSPFADIWS